MKAMILAAGRGERMGALTRHRPKPLMSVGQSTLIERHLRALAEYGFKEVVINVCYLRDQIMQHLGDGRRFGLKITYSIEESMLGSGGGPLHAADLLGSDPFLLISCDIALDYKNVDILAGLNTMKTWDMQAHLWLVDPTPEARGFFSLNQGQVSTFGTALLDYAGFSWNDPILFKSIAARVFELPVLWKKALWEGRVSGQLYSGRWFNIGNPQILAQANKAYQEEHLL